MNPNLQHHIDSYEKGGGFAYRTSVNIGVKDESNPGAPVFKRKYVEVEFEVSRDGPSLHSQLARFYKDSGAPVSVPELPRYQVFLELHKNGYDVAKIAEMCGETEDAVIEFFTKKTYSRLERLTLAVISRPENEWAQYASEPETINL